MFFNGVLSGFQHVAIGLLRCFLDGVLKGFSMLLC